VTTHTAACLIDRGYIATVVTSYLVGPKYQRGNLYFDGELASHYHHPKNCFFINNVLVFSNYDNEKACPRNDYVVVSGTGFLFIIDQSAR